MKVYWKTCLTTVGNYVPYSEVERKTLTHSDAHAFANGPCKVTANHHIVLWKFLAFWAQFWYRFVVSLRQPSPFQCGGPVAFFLMTNFEGNLTHVSLLRHQLPHVSSGKVMSPVISFNWEYTTIICRFLVVFEVRVWSVCTEYEFFLASWNIGIRWEGTSGSAALLMALLTALCAESPSLWPR